MSEQSIIDRAPAATVSATVVQDTLPPGTRLAEFEVIRVLGIGGFGIVYLALDHALLRYVAIKEYMPFALASRGAGPLITIRSEADAETFALGLRSFINEARLLASFDHPSLVKVYRFWEEHGTAYMVMQFYPGRTLKEERRAMEGAPNEAWLRGFVDPLLGALELLHSEGVYHRDISPDNILLLPDGRPVLLDFGAARRVIGDRTQTLTAILKPNFAPVEQYADVVGMRQGPWTDLYALGAVIRFMVTAQPPTPAAARAVHDDMRGLATPEHAMGLDVSPTFLSAIDWALVIKPQERPQSVRELRDALNGSAPAPRASTAQMQMAVSVPAAKPSTEPVITQVDLERKNKGDGYRVAQIASVAAAVVLLSVAAAMWANPKPITPAASARMVAPAPVKAIEQPVASPMVETTVTPSSMQSRASEPAHNMKRKQGTDALASHREVSPSAVAGRSPPVATSRPVPPAQQVAPIVAQSPRQACGDRMIITMVICMSRECRTPRFQHHPQCLEMQRAEALRHETQMTR